MIQLTKEDFEILRSKFSITKFAKTRTELTSTINELSTNPPKEQQQSLMQYNIVIARRNDVAILLDNDLQTSESEINKNKNNYNFMPNLQQVSKNYFTLLDVVSVRNYNRAKFCCS